MAIAYDNSALVTTGGQTNVDTASWAIAGANRALVAFLASGASAPSTPSACVWGTSGGDSLTIDGAAASISFIKMTKWGVLSPTAASRVLRGTWPATDDEQFMAGLSYTGVDSFRTSPTSVTNAGSNSPSLTFTTVAGDVCVAAVWILDLGGGGPDITSDGAQTNRVLSENGGGGFTFESFAVDEKLAAGTSTTISWTLDGSYAWITAGRILVPSAAADEFLGQAIT
jgi:hypothetical protein